MDREKADDKVTGCERYHRKSTSKSHISLQRPPSPTCIRKPLDEITTSQVNPFVTPDAFSSLITTYLLMSAWRVCRGTCRNMPLRQTFRGPLRNPCSPPYQQ